MALMRHRQRPLTAVSPHQGNKTRIIPKRNKLGPKVPSQSGEDHTVTLTGPDQSEDVIFDTEPERRYRLYSALISSTDELFTESFHPDIIQFGAASVAPVALGNTLIKDGLNPSMANEHGGVTFTATATAQGVRCSTSSDVDPAYSVTFGHFYIREIKA